MSDNQNLSKSQRKRQKRREKRKASNSPETDVVGHYASDYSSSATGVTTTHTIQDYPNGLIDNDRYVNSVMSFNTSPVMNFSQPIQPVQFGFQTPQSNQVPNVFTGTPAPSLPPAWALPLLDDVKSIKAALPKIDQIEQSVKSMNLKITAFESKLSTLENKIQEIEQSASFMNTAYEEQKGELKETKSEMQKLQKLCNEMEKSITTCNQREEDATDKLLDLEARSMRENLIFYGLPETTSADSQPTTENCEKLVKELITSKLQLDATPMVLDRAHRLGGNRARKPRPIVVKFHRYSDREAVRLKSHEDAIKTSLRGSNLGVGIQSPQQYRDARKAFAEHVKREEERGQRARVIGNKLYVNNRVVKKYVNGSVCDQ